MNRDVAMWFSKRLPTFVNVPKDHPHIEEQICYFLQDKAQSNDENHSLVITGHNLLP
ncbi:hypothetical protein P7K49_017718 [Saguinus oedipus]|uniref:Uncharacterized protein n=1 Tax=Saguinus oedipus TaxID=9490 RepID=A0ABQ9V3A5_SAGOE|nr:hypothetical protein P7K49_017718 [Saguinus oedipus]